MHGLLFLLTSASVMFTGVVVQGEGLGGATALTVSVIGIMLAHEMGHYVAARLYGVDATLPFFLPAPILNPLVGTFGAVIRIRSPFPDRRALFDIGVAGPLAGFLVCLPVLYLGILEAQVVVAPPSAFGLQLADPLLFQWAFAWLRGDVPAGGTVLIGPFGMAAWFGLFLTGLNLIPIGQLDGGHMTYALFREGAHVLARAAWWLCVLAVFLVGPQWFLWAILVRLLGLRHPRTLDDARPLGAARMLVALLTLGVFVLCFLPNPLEMTWERFLDDLSACRQAH